MELDELHVQQRGTGLISKRRPITVVLVVPRGVAVVDGSIAASSENDTASVEQQKPAGVHIEADGSVNALAVRNQLRDHHVLAVGNRQLLGTFNKRIKQRLAGVVARKRGPAERLGTEVPLVDLSVVRS